MHISLSPVGNYWIVTAVALVLLALMMLGPMQGKVSLARRRVLVGLRLAIITLVALAMLRPALVHSVITRQPATLIVLLDQSRSMEVADAAGKRTRWEALRSAVLDALPRLTALEQDLEVQMFTFDSEPHVVERSGDQLELPAKPEGAESAIGHVIEEVVRRSTGKRLAGVVLVSDGAQRAEGERDTAPQVAARRLADLGYPLHTVPLGQGQGIGQARDVALSDLRVPASVFVKNQLPVNATVRIDGYVNQKLPVQLLVETEPGKMQPVEAKPVQASRDGQEFAIELEHLPETSGEKKVTIVVAPQPGEAITTNNELSTFVTIRSEGLSVLYLEGVSRIEQKFIRRAMDASPDIRVDYVRLDAQKLELNPPDIANRFRAGEYDVYIVGDLDSKVLPNTAWQRLSDAVNAGAGFMMLGGVQSFGGGGYGNTPLGEVLPIVVKATDRQPLGEKVREDLHLAGSPQMRLTAIGRTQSLLMLDNPAKNDQVWQSFPPLDGANKFIALKPGAQTLIETANGEPLLVAKNYGTGRVLAFAGDSTWRWPLYGFADAHRRFWRQSILWLARKDIQQEGQVWVALERRRFSPGMRVEFTTGARSPQGDAVPEAQFDVEVITPDGRKLVPRLERGSSGERQGVVFGAVDPGDYTIRTTAKVAGVTLGTSQARFLVYAQDLELENPAADRGTLEAIATMTGGKTIVPEQLGGLIDDIRQAAHQFEVETQIKDTLWDNWPFFLVFIMLLSVEWYLRKKWGLV